MKIPPHVKSLCRDLEKFHPDWEYKFWSNCNYPEDIPNNFFPVIERSRRKTRQGRNMGAVEADLLRYLIVSREGGVYMDCDFVIKSSLNNLDLTKNLILCAPHPWGHWICNGFIAAKPNHKLMMDAVDNVHIQKHTYFGPMYLSEIFKKIKSLPPGKLTDVRRMHLTLSAEEQILDRGFFFGKRAKIATHLNLGSWLPKNNDSAQL